MSDPLIVTGILLFIVAASVRLGFHLANNPYGWWKKKPEEQEEEMMTTLIANDFPGNDMGEKISNASDCISKGFSGPFRIMVRPGIYNLTTPATVGISKN